MVVDVTTPHETTLLPHAVDAAPDGVLIVDEDGTVVYANRAIREMVGVDDLVGTSVDDLVPADARARHEDLRGGYHEHPVSRPMRAGLGLRMVRFDGTELPVEIALSPVDGRFVVASVRDVSERLEAQQRLSEANQQLALVAERERIGRDLHDVVLQHLYGTGLSVQALGVSNPELGDRLDQILADVDDIIGEVRTIVFTLGDSAAHGSLGQELGDVVAKARRVLGFTPAIRLDGPVESVLTSEIRTELIASMREALGNVARHADATQATVRIDVVEGHVVMTVTDDGVGPPADEAALRGGHGLGNLQRRATSLGGTCALAAGEQGGAVLRWAVPFPDGPPGADT